jgi:hypothetical protein
MNREELLEAFASLSAEDQDWVRKAIAAEGKASDPAGGGCCDEFEASMAVMMEKMKSCCDPKAMPEEMKKKMRSCCDA